MTVDGPSLSVTSGLLPWSWVTAKSVGDRAGITRALSFNLVKILAFDAMLKFSVRAQLRGLLRPG